MSEQNFQDDSVYDKYRWIDELGGWAPHPPQQPAHRREHGRVGLSHGLGSSSGATTAA